MVLGVINWKTCAAGAASLCGAIADLLSAYAHGTMPHWEADFTAITVGIGLIFAKDSNVTGGSVSNVDGATHSTISIISSTGGSNLKAGPISS